MTVKIEIPIRIGRGLNERGHWRTKWKRSQAERMAGRLAVQASAEWKANAIALPVLVTLVRIAPKKMDDDNVVGGFKAVRDGVADALGIDDGDENITFRYGQRSGAPKQYAAEITITSYGENE